MKRKTMFFLIISICLMSIGLSACKRKEVPEQETGEITPAPTALVTQALSETGESRGEAGDTADQIQLLSKAEAEQLLQDAIQDEGYSFDLVNENIDRDGSSYYEFQISDGSSAIEPDVLVNKISGELLCYYSDSSTKPFSEFPLFAAANSKTGDEESGFTKEDALAKLEKLTAGTLGLSESLNKYRIIFDDWTTNVKGLNCYGINAYEKEKGTTAGIFYVAVDGSKVYRYDSNLDDFVEITDEK